MNIRNVLDNEITEYELLNYYNATITNIGMPNYINGFIFLYKDVYNIYLNRNLNEIKKRTTLLHELAHLELNHLHSKKTLLEFNIKNAEDDADKYIKFIKEL